MHDNKLMKKYARIKYFQIIMREKHRSYMRKRTYVQNLLLK